MEIGATTGTLPSAENQASLPHLPRRFPHLFIRDYFLEKLLVYSSHQSPIDLQENTTASIEHSDALHSAETLCMAF